MLVKQLGDELHIWHAVAIGNHHISGFRFCIFSELDVIILSPPLSLQLLEEIQFPWKCGVDNGIVFL